MKLIIAASLLIVMMPVSAASSLFYTRGGAENSYIVTHPFNREAAVNISGLPDIELSTLNSGAAANVEFIHYSIQNLPAGQAPLATRSISININKFLDTIDRSLSAYRRNGCSSTKISYPNIQSFTQSALFLRIDVSHKKRACDNILGKHDIYSGSGNFVIKLSITAKDAKPVLKTTVESIKLDVNKVFGISTSSFVGELVNSIIFELSHFFGQLGISELDIGDSLGQVTTDLENSLSQAMAVMIEKNVPKEVLYEIIKNYGSISAFLKNNSAQSFGLKSELSGFYRYRIYTPKAEFQNIGTNDCLAISRTEYKSYYCQPTQSEHTHLTLVYQKKLPALPILINEANDYIFNEIIFLKSLSDDVQQVFIPEFTDKIDIVNKYYHNLDFLDFFNENNKNPNCSNNSIESQKMCEWKIVPAWHLLRK